MCSSSTTQTGVGDREGGILALQLVGLLAASAIAGGVLPLQVGEVPLLRLVGLLPQLAGLLAASAIAGSVLLAAPAISGGVLLLQVVEVLQVVEWHLLREDEAGLRLQLILLTPPSARVLPCLHTCCLDRQQRCFRPKPSFDDIMSEMGRRCAGGRRRAQALVACGRWRPMQGPGPVVQGSVKQELS